MYITRVPNRKSPPAILLRESYRDNGKVKSRTLANLSKLPEESIEVLRRSLHGEQLVPASDAFEAIASSHHGHVQAVLHAMRRLGFAELIAARASAQRDLVVAMVVAPRRVKAERAAAASAAPSVGSVPLPISSMSTSVLSSACSRMWRNANR